MHTGLASKAGAPSVVEEMPTRSRYYCTSMEPPCSQLGDGLTEDEDASQPVGGALDDASQPVGDADVEGDVPAGPHALFIKACGLHDSPASFSLPAVRWRARAAVAWLRRLGSPCAGGCAVCVFVPDLLCM